MYPVKNSIKEFKHVAGSNGMSQRGFVLAT